LLGYGAAFELLQFVYDLNLWSSLGAKRNIARGVPLRIMLRGHTFSPLYWKTVHNGLVDLVRQLGFPSIFFTMAPYEWAYPYHTAILDEMTKLLRPRLQLPALETMHIAHTMTQLVVGFLAGKNQHVAARAELTACYRCALQKPILARRFAWPGCFRCSLRCRRLARCWCMLRCRSTVALASPG
jgi:hypothetical protein